MKRFWIAVSLGLSMISILAAGAIANAAELQNVTTATEGGHFVAVYNFSDAVTTDAIKFKYDKSGVELSIPQVKLPTDQNLIRIGENGIKSVLTMPAGDTAMRSKIFFSEEVASPDQLQDSVRAVATGSTIKVFVKKIGEEWSNEALGIADVKPSALDEDFAKALKEAAVVDTEAVNESAEAVNMTASVATASTAAAATGPATGTATASAEPSAAAAVQADASANTAAAVPATKTAASAAAASVQQNATVSVDAKESEIPVLENLKEKKADTSNPFMRIILSLVLIAGLGFGLIAFSKWYQKKGTKNVDTNKIRVLTQHFLGPRKSLAIIRVAGETILIGVTDHNISMIKSLALLDDQIIDDVPRDFAKELTKSDAKVAAGTAKGAPAGATANPGSVVDSDEDNFADDFVLSSIKDKVTAKIKNLRPLA